MCYTEDIYIYISILDGSVEKTSKSLIVEELCLGMKDLKLSKCYIRTHCTKQNKTTDNSII